MGRELHHITVACLICGKEFQRKVGKTAFDLLSAKRCLCFIITPESATLTRNYYHLLQFCSNECRDENRRNRHRDDHKKRRAMKKKVKYESIKSAKVFERDNWVCGICKTIIDSTKVWPDKYCKSIDHIIPLSKLGPHTYDNVQAAHWICNTRKGNQ